MHLGFEPDSRKSRGHDMWFCSPFRPDEKEASFHIHTGHCIWKDFGLTGKSGGDLIYFAQKFLEEQGKPFGISDALEWFESISGGGMPSISKQAPKRVAMPETSPFEMLSVKAIFSQPLFDYLAERKISRETGQRFLKQVYFLHRESGRKIYGLGFANRKGGYDVRNPLGFKGAIGSKDVSLLSGSKPSGQVDVFEGFFDFLSFVELYSRAGHPINDCMVLNSNSLYALAAELIKEKGYNHVRLWLDNDKGGQTGRVAIQEACEQDDQPKIKFETMHHLYSGCTDLNAWHQQKPDNQAIDFSFQ